MKTKDFTIDDVQYYVRSATLSDQKEAKKIYNSAFADAISSGAIVRGKINDVLIKQGMWSDEKENELKNLQKNLTSQEKRLARGGIKLSEARALALEIADSRKSIRDLLMSRNSLDSNSAEGQADNAQFDYLVSACSFKKSDNSKCFENLEDYLNRGSEPLAAEAARNYAELFYGLDSSYEKNLPENKFLLKYKFVNPDLHFVNKEGHLTDRDGKLVDKDGFYVDADNRRIDKFGNLLTKDGEFLVDEQPFLDDDGKPVVFDEKSAKVEEVKSEQKQD